MSAEFAEALADLRRAETDGRVARDTLARVRDLHGAGLIPTRELIEAQASANRSAIERERARTRLAQVGVIGAGPLHAGTSTAKGRAAGAGGTAAGGTAAGGNGAIPSSSANFLLRAPIAGVVVERAVNPGQEVRSDQGGAPMFVITDPTRLWAWLDAAEGVLPRLAGARVGTPLKIRSGAWGNREFDAMLVRKEDAIDPASRTFRLRADVDNPSRDLKAEMFVTAMLVLPDDAGDELVEIVPAAAVLLVDGRHGVFVQDGDHDFRRVDVTVVRELPAGPASPA